MESRDSPDTPLYHPLPPQHTRLVQASLAEDGKLALELLTVDISKPKDTLPLYVGTMHPGVQIWMLKGGKMLYILRPALLGA